MGLKMNIVKILHFIHLGNRNLTDPIITNLESWKRCYPDFEIMYWNDSNIGELIEDCPYIKHCYDLCFWGYVSDYVRLKVTQIYGGLYMDSDVYCVNRIPDSYFEKPFIPWSVEFCSHNSCTGTATYNNIPNNPLWEEFLDKYRNLEVCEDIDFLINASINNSFIDTILYEHGLNCDDIYHCSLKDQDLGDILIPNRVQFGYTDYRAEHPMINYLPKDSKIYLMHNYLSSWCVSDKEIPVDLWYTVIREDTDTNKLIDWLRDNFIRENTPNNCILMIFVDNIVFKEEELLTFLRVVNPKDTLERFTPFKWRVEYIGDGRDDLYEAQAVTNYLCTKFTSVTSTKNLNALLHI